MENVWLIFEVTEFLQEHEEPSLLSFADFEKAFDSLDHNYIIKSLKYFNFGKFFIKWVKLFYHDITSIMINNGFLSESIPIKRGVRQGCALSSSFFIIFIEALTNYIKKGQRYKMDFSKQSRNKTNALLRWCTFMNEGSKESFEKLVITLKTLSVLQA